jgi:hypothetical protein
MRLFGPVATDCGKPLCSPHQPVYRRQLAAVCSRFALVIGLFGLSVLPAPRAGAQAAGGTITGRVTDAATGNPVSQVRVLVAGTQNGALTAENGRYTIRVTTNGTVTLDVNRIGYVAQKATATLTGATAPVVVDVVLTQAAFSLSAVVTTVTGQQRKVELANAVAQINVAEKIAELPVSNMGALLQGRTSSVQVLQNGGAGTGSRIRIRGQNSFSLSNDPIVVIDGVRANSAINNSLSTGVPWP